MTRSPCRLLAAAGLIALVACFRPGVCLAQNGGATGEPALVPAFLQPPTSSLSMVPFSMLQSDLDLSAAQRARVARIQKGLWSGIRVYMNRPGKNPGGMPNFAAIQQAKVKLEAQQRQSDQQIDALLTPGQRRRTGTMFQEVGTFKEAGVPLSAYSSLRLAPAQRAKIAAMQPQLLAQTKAGLQQAVASAHGANPLGAIMALQQRAWDRVMAVLTPRQRAIAAKAKRAEAPLPGGRALSRPATRAR